jgi:hypothetical protein
LPLTNAASIGLMSALMACHPDADFFSLYDAYHLQVEPGIFVPLRMLQEDMHDVLAEVAREILRRDPRANAERLLERKFEGLQGGGAVTTGLVSLDISAPGNSGRRRRPSARFPREEKAKEDRRFESAKQKSW